LALDGIQVTSMAVKKRMAHLVYDHVALLASYAARRRSGFPVRGAGGMESEVALV